MFQFVLPFMAGIIFQTTTVRELLKEPIQIISNALGKKEEKIPQSRRITRRKKKIEAVIDTEPYYVEREDGEPIN